MIKVLIADDQALVRDGLNAILDAQDDIDVVGEADDGQAAIDLSGQLDPDVVLMDIRMPRMDGIEATRRLAGRPRVLILTTFGEDEYVYEALKAGAAGFMLKDSKRGQLIHAVRTVAAGEELLAPTITRRLIEECVRRPPAPDGTPAPLAELTERELEVMRLVARGMTNEEIAAELIVSGATVKTHVAHILQKLGLRDRVQAVVLAYECGLARPGDA